MDFRSFSKSENRRLAASSTVVTPQLEDYALFRSFREFQEISYLQKRQPFMLVLNLASVLESELKITRVKLIGSEHKDVLQVQVVHSMKEMQDLVIFSRDCTYRYNLPDNLFDEPLSALWTVDHHLIVVESSNIDPKMRSDVNDTSVTNDRVTFIVPRKVNSMYQPSVSVDVLRNSVALAESELAKALKYIQHGSFVRPDVGRPEVEMEGTESIDGNGSEAVLKTEFIEDCIGQLEHILGIVETKKNERKIVETDEEIERSIAETNEETGREIAETVEKNEKSIVESDEKMV